MRSSDWSSDVCSSDPNFPTAHGNHFHVGDAVVLASDAGGLGNPNVFAILERKGLLRSLHPMGALLTAEALAYDTGLADQVLRSEEHTSELQSLMRTSYAVFCLTKKTNTCRIQPTVANR